MKTAKIQISLAIYDDAGALLCEEIKPVAGDGLISVTFNKQLHVSGEVATGSPETLDLSTIATAKAFILFNRGTADMAYRASGAGSDSGIISPGGSLLMAAAGFDAIEISTGNLTPVPYEFWQLGE